MKNAFLVLMIFPLLFSCEEEKKNVDLCGPKAKLSEDFLSRNSDAFSINSAEVSGTCLSIDIVAGGCDGESWNAELLVSPVVAESYPTQVGLRMILHDDELCEAAIKQTFQFDLSPLNIISDRMILHLEGWDKQLSYNLIEIKNLKGTWSLVNLNGSLAGFNEDFEIGEITWSFGEMDVVIENNSDQPISGFESGEYTYNVNKKESSSFVYELQIGEQNLGPITRLTPDSLVVDQRAVDGLQYTLIK